MSSDRMDQPVNDNLIERLLLRVEALATRFEPQDSALMNQAHSPSSS